MKVACAVGTVKCLANHINSNTDANRFYWLHLSQKLTEGIGKELMDNMKVRAIYVRTMLTHKFSTVIHAVRR